jgi:hypothetical protein
MRKIIHSPLRPRLGEVSLELKEQIPDGVDTDSVYTRGIRWLIWTYLILWIIEGALRKWYLPGLSNPLLVVRDPVVILIYLMAFAGNVFPVNRVVAMLAVLGAMSFVAGLLVTGNLAMTAYGFRSNFLHLPLIYVMARVLRPADLRKIGLFLLACSVPMAIIMAKQFQSGYDSWWNLGAGGGRQIISVDGRIRAAGTFSFISGPVCFFGLVTSFLISAVTLNKWFRWWLLIPSAAATMLAAAVAGSRGLLVTIVIGLVFFLIGCARYPRAFSRVGLIAFGALVAFLCVGFLDVYKEGKAVTTDRATGATRNEGGFQGFVHRAIAPLLITPEALMSYQILGRGLGTGTVAASALAKGADDQPVWAEDEWSRVLLESGPILGLAYLALRATIVIGAYIQSMQAARRGNLFAIALFGAAGPAVLTGQFGQPTSQGAAGIAMGLCLAALSLRSHDTVFGSEDDESLEAEKLGSEDFIPDAALSTTRRGRSAYAEKLHRK